MRRTRRSAFTRISVARHIRRVEADHAYTDCTNGSIRPWYRRPSAAWNSRGYRRMSREANRASTHAEFAIESCLQRGAACEGRGPVVRRQTLAGFELMMLSYNY